MKFTYPFGLFLYALLLRVAALLGNKKAKIFLSGRRKDRLKIRHFKRSEITKLYWFHCASLGEYDQAEPLIRALKEDDNELKILLTFFSPSGYEQKKDNSIGDYVFYLPLDTKKNAKLFVESLKPDKAFFVKYEFWANYFININRNSIPLYIVSGVFRKDQVFFKSYGKWYMDILKHVNYFFLQDEKSENLLKQFGFENTLISGDTRFDKVVENAVENKEIYQIKKFTESSFTLILGSSWQEEENMLAEIYSEFSNDVKLLIVPHDVSKSHINDIVKKFAQYSPHLYSDEKKINSNVVVVDSVGVLKYIYKYASVAFVGGGFKNALHNILEPAVFGLPVIYGDNHQKYHEAKNMIDFGSGFEVTDSNELREVLMRLKDPNELKKASKKARLFIDVNQGATQRIVKRLKEIE